ncbi:MAG: hypothetical protein U0941_00640 [Planctomycetaceae bacterium]
MAQILLGLRSTDMDCSAVSVEQAGFCGETTPNVKRSAAKYRTSDACSRAINASASR